MDKLRGKVAFVTGGANGIGLAMARAFVDAGMKVAIADIDDEGLSRATASFTTPGTVVLPVRLDVTDRYMWAAAADRVEAALGPVQLLCCNAGVAGSRESLQEVGIGAWQWAFDVNVNGTLYGLKTFSPRLRGSGKDCHVVISVAWNAFQAEPHSGISAATQAAQVAMAETLRQELKDTRVGVSVLCTGPVNTGLIPNTIRYSKRVGVRVVVDGSHMRRLSEGQDADEVAGRVLGAIKKKRFWVFTQNDVREGFEDRAHEILAGIYDSGRAVSAI
jgi:NAD(P)-dependent dehydrogenase (short-subunit alcohol dehydrogenase family)